MYGYNPMYPQSPFMPPPPMSSRGFIQPRQMVGYRQEEPSFGSKLARLGLQGVSKGVGQIAKDSFIGSMTEEEPEEKSATGGAGKAAGSTAGATIGSYLLPGAGTIIGGFAGGVTG